MTGLGAPGGAALEPDAVPEPPPPDAAALKSKARRGVFALVLQTILLRGGLFAGGIALARLLDPADFGVFTIVQTALQFFTFFGDCGVGGALIRQKHEPTRRELSSVFYFQLAIALVVTTLVWFASSYLHFVWPDFPERGVWIIRALAVDALLTVLRVIPSILLERRLAYGRIAILEAIVQVSFMGTAIGMAALGMHVWALAIGVLVQGVVALVGAQILQPFWPNLVYDGKKLMPIIKFGLTYQVKNIVGFINGLATPIVGGRMGATNLGYVNFARDTAWYPLKLVEIIGRVNFPLYARLQGDRKLFSETLSRSIQVCGMATMASVAFFLGLGPSIIHVVYGDKWLPALPLLYIFAAAITFGFLSPIVGAALDASGRPGVLARLAVGWTILELDRRPHRHAALGDARLHGRLHRPRRHRQPRRGVDAEEAHPRGRDLAPDPGLDRLWARGRGRGPAPRRLDPHALLALARHPEVHRRDRALLRGVRRIAPGRRSHGARRGARDEQGTKSAASRGPARLSEGRRSAT